MNTLSISKNMTPATSQATQHRGIANALPLILLGLWIGLVGRFLYAFASSGWAWVPR